MLHLRFKCIILEVFKFIQGTILACIQNIFQIKKPSYFIRDSSITLQSKRNPTIFGLRSFSYFGNKLWNDLPSHLNETTDFITFKDQLPNWCGPDLSGLLNVYVYPLFNDFWTVSFLNIYQIFYQHTGITVRHYIYIYICIYIYECVCMCVWCICVRVRDFYMHVQKLLCTYIHLSRTQVCCIYIIYFFVCAVDICTLLYKH